MRAKTKTETFKKLNKLFITLIIIQMSRPRNFFAISARRAQHRRSQIKEIKTVFFLTRWAFFFSSSRSERNDDHRRFGEKDVIMKINWSIIKNHHDQSATQRETLWKRRERDSVSNFFYSLWYFIWWLRQFEQSEKEKKERNQQQRPRNDDDEISPRSVFKLFIFLLSDTYSNDHQFTDSINVKNALAHIEIKLLTAHWTARLGFYIYIPSRVSPASQWRY